MPLILFNKPYGVLSQFRDSSDRPVLADFIDIPDVYPAGRLDYNSEGLLLLTDDGRLQARISSPANKLPKHYLVQVEGEATPEQARELVSGVSLKDGVARAKQVELADSPGWLWERDPPIRFRRTVPTSWLTVVLTEGRNRQVRRMTASVGLPTLRLVRFRIGPFMLGKLRPGDCLELSNRQAWRRLIRP